MSYIDKITNKDTGESRVISPAAEAVRVSNENYEGENLDEVLDEIDEAIKDASDKSELQTAITNLQNALNTLIGSGNVQGAIDTFNEVVAFLAGISSSDTLAAKLAQIQQSIPSVDGFVTESDVEDMIEEAVADIEAGETQVVSVDDVAILDGFTHNTILAAASARSVMLLKNNVDTLYSKLNDLFDKLAGIAFTNDKPTSSWKPAWSAAAFPTHTITVGTLTDVTVYYDGTAKAAGSTITADEGEVTLKLTPASNTMLLASGISIKKSGNIDVDFTTAAGTGADAGSTLVTFVLGVDVTFSAAASSGIAVQLAGTNSGNVTQSVNGVPLSGDNRAIVLSHAEHYSWDGNTITLSVNGVNLTATTDYTITDNQDGTKTVTILKEFTSDTYPIVITVGAVEDNHAVLDITNVGSNVTVKRSGSTLADGAHVYQGETINIVPGSGYSVSASATSGGNDVTLSGDSTGYSYTLGAGDVSSSGVTIAITASATALIHMIFGTLSHCAVPSGVTNPTGVEESGTVNIQLQCDAGYSIKSADVTIRGATVGTITNVGQIFTIPITHDGISQSISIAVSASEALPYEVPTNGELLYWWDGKTVQAGDTAWVDKINGLSVPKSSNKDSTTTPDATNHCWKFESSYNSSGRGLSIDSQSLDNIDADDCTIEVVYKAGFDSSFKRANVCIFHRRETSGTYGVPNGIYYCSKDGTSGNDAFICGCNAGDVNDGTWAMTNVNNEACCVAINNDNAMKNGVALSLKTGDNTTGYVVNTGSASGTGAICIGCYSNAANKYSVFKGDIYAIRIYSGHLTPAQMLANQKVDNVRYGLGLTLPESLSN